jgi:hypothetical protein
MGITGSMLPSTAIKYASTGFISYITSATGIEPLSSEKGSALKKKVDIQGGITLKVSTRNSLNTILFVMG